MEKELKNGREAEGMTLETRAKAKARVKPDIAMIAESKGMSE